jgi:formylmethanofuran:tetrahydromethanopterin formyltransferase
MLIEFIMVNDTHSEALNVRRPRVLIFGRNHALLT